MVHPPNWGRAEWLGCQETAAPEPRRSRWRFSPRTGNACALHAADYGGLHVAVHDTLRDLDTGPHRAGRMNVLPL